MSVIVLADDLTGACECAGVGQRLGRRAQVQLEPGPTARSSPTRSPSHAGPDVLIISTETRLLPAMDAARRLAAFGAGLAGQVPPAVRVFKKTDSVLRGPVVAELEALALALRRQRILLVPANPQLGRQVVAGRYTIGGVPLPETPFGRDPHHPARSAAVAELLAQPLTFTFYSLDPTEEVPLGALAVGDAASPADVAAWARRVTPDTLPAGGAAFFEAFLVAGRAVTSPLAAVPPPAPPPAGPLLLLSGTTVPAQRTQLRNDSGLEILALNDLDNRSALRAWSERLESRLRRDGRASGGVEGPVVPGPERAARIRAAIAAVALRAVQRQLVRHLVIEGGATAATVAAALDWKVLDAVQEWSPGVVSLRPAGSPNCLLTLKPGSYPWPAELAALLPCGPR